MNICWDFTDKRFLNNSLIRIVLNMSKVFVG